jgi:hypothetical protein
MLIAFEDAHEVLSQYYSKLWSVVDGAWADYQAKIAADVRAIASTRSRASLVHDFMVKRALDMAEANSGMQPIWNRLLFALTIQSKHGFIAMRLKKLSEEGISRNNPTKQVEDFRNQEQIPGIDAKFHLELGYILNQNQDAIQSIELVCPSGRGIYWMAEVTPESATENVFNLWEHRGEEEQQSTGFTVKRRKIATEENDSSTGTT